MIARFFLGVRHRFWVGGFLLLATIGFAGGLARLSLDTSFDSLIPYDDPDRLIYQRVMEEFGSDNKTIVYVRDEALWTPKSWRRSRACKRNSPRFRKCCAWTASST